MNHPLQNSDTREIYYWQWIAKADRREVLLKRMLSKYFKEQMRRILEALRQFKGYQSRQKALIDSIFNITTENGIAIELSFPVLQQILEEAGVDTLTMVNPEDVFLTTPEIEKFLVEKALKMVESMNNTTLIQLTNTLAEGIGDKEGFRELSKRVRNVYGQISKGRINTIVRTETTSVSQKGNIEGYRQGGVTIKIWVTTLDGRERDSHHLVDGEEQPLDQPFSNGLLFPGDPIGPPEEVINCRCTI